MEPVHLFNRFMILRLILVVHIVHGGFSSSGISEIPHKAEKGYVDFFKTAASLSSQAQLRTCQA
jgi:hypothetical protein